MMKWAVSLMAVTASASVAASPPGTRTYANPIDIDYRYNWEQVNEGISYRTGADPAIVNHKGRIYMFQTLADGYWSTDNLVDWTFITPSKWRVRGVVAPAVWSDGERLYMLPSTTEPTAIFVSDKPETGQLDYLTRRMPELPNVTPRHQLETLESGLLPPGPWDPALFKDDDGRWYMYWNSSNVFPLYGIELDPKKRLSYVGNATTLFGLHPEQHGWERFGKDHNGLMTNGQPIAPFMEGAWMTKVGGKYFLQYGAPGTEFNAYANGTYVADKPLGPFTYAPWNPVSYKPGGFVIGAGHGSTFQDNHGNWWNSGTPWVGYNWNFERRIAIFPTKFYADGQMASSNRFGDYPQYAPDRKVDDIDSLFAGWMLLSYRKPAVATSMVDGFGPQMAFDEDYKTFWLAKSAAPGEGLTVDLGAVKTVRAVQLNYADYKQGIFGDAPEIYTEMRIEASADGTSWKEVARTEAPRRDRPNFYAQLKAPARARYVRFVHEHIGGPNLAIAELRVFGNADGAPPSRPIVRLAKRQQDQRNADIRWDAVKGAQGYNVRWGIRPDRLTLTYQKYTDQLTDPARPSLELRALNVGVPYYVAVEAFDERGVSKLSKVVRVR